MHPLKIYSKDLTEERMKLLISKWYNELQSKNNDSIFITFSVLKFDKSIEVNDLQLLNIEFIFTTFEVSNLIKFNEFSLKHPENIEFIFVTFDVLKLDIST